MTTRDFKFDGTGLIPAIVQDWLDGTVLMLGYMNEAALTKTLSTNSVHFWSRSRRPYGKEVKRPATSCS